jgi:hypothetical protein
MDIRGVFNSDLITESLALERMQGRINNLKPQMFPDTATTTLPDWIRTRGAIVSDTASIEDKRAAVIAKERSFGARKKSDFYQIGKALGYNTYVDSSTPIPYIRIVESEFLGFIVGYSIVGIDLIRDDGVSNSRYSISVYGTSVIEDAQLQALFNNAHILGTAFVFINE